MTNEEIAQAIGCDIARHKLLDNGEALAVAAQWHGEDGHERWRATWRSLVEGVPMDGGRAITRAPTPDDFAACIAELKEGQP
jgi:hypothetical protein